MIEEPKDKRTKEWKIYKANFDKTNSVGLGDVIEKVTEVTGIKKAVELFTSEGKDCGCDKRKESLNKVKLRFPLYRCFTEDLYNQWGYFRNRPHKDQVTHQEQLLIIEVTELLFVRSFKPCSRCGTEIQSRINEIDKVYDKYQ